MSKETIAKFSAFVICAALVFSACAFTSAPASEQASDSPYGPPKVVGTIKSPDVTESSGVAASRCQSNVLWTHNDSGDDAFIYALDHAGNSLGTWKVPNAKNIDWEDIAAYKDKAGKCFLYIGEIGDNKTKRHEHIVYRVAEPVIVPENSSSTRKAPLTTGEAEVLHFIYPDYDQDAETVMVNPKTADIYVVTKRVSGPAGVYRIKPDFGSSDPVKAEAVAEISVPAIPNGLITGGDISPDGTLVILCDYTRGYELQLPAGAQDFDVVWAQKPQPVELGERANGEAVSYSVDGNAIYATSEKRKGPAPVIEVKRRR
jgi:hypothetical protein